MAVEPTDTGDPTGILDDATQAVAELRRALHGTEELRLLYQPQVDLDGGAVMGVEAFIRWRHPRLGVLLPADFLPVAAEGGLMPAVDAWVLERAARQLAFWRGIPGRGPMSISVNVSPGQLLDPRFPDTVDDALTRHAVPADLLCLDITEHAAMGDLDRAEHNLLRLRCSGVRLALDDFGTGLSSLSWLKRLPVDTVKIDRSFVAGLGHGTADLAIASAIVGMAAALDLEVVAEGVETVRQLTILRELGCDTGQGYLWAPPLEAPELDAWLRALHPVVASAEPGDGGEYDGDAGDGDGRPRRHLRAL